MEARWGAMRHRLFFGREVEGAVSMVWYVVSELIVMGLRGEVRRAGESVRTVRTVRTGEVYAGVVWMFIAADPVCHFP